MEAASSSVAAAAPVAHNPTRTDPAGGRMQVDEKLEDLENTQVTKLGRKRWKEDERRKRNAHSLRGGSRAEQPWR